ncbi:MAG: hypothetical protein KDE33_18390 [Bacteroidetes bacterium]|nr:hypothetical protein [Bacteroidota bacterium]
MVKTLADGKNNEPPTKPVSNSTLRDATTHSQTVSGKEKDQTKIYILNEVF